MGRPAGKRTVWGSAVVKNNEAKFDFSSVEWIAYAREYLEAQTDDVDLTGINVAFNEVFTDAPAHLNPDAEGKIGWYVRIADGSLEVAPGILASADLVQGCDYETVLPATRRLSTDKALDEATQRVLKDSIFREGDETAMADFEWMKGLHDAMAVRTR